MTLEQYLDELEHAITVVIQALWRDHDEVLLLTKEIEALRATARVNYSRAESIRDFSEDPEDAMVGVGLYWQTYFGEDKDQHDKSTVLAGLESKVQARQISYAALSTALLQYAKQALSLAYGPTSMWPAGKSVGSQRLAEVIVQSRNQAEHWEEGNFRRAVEECFIKLEAEVDAVFGKFRTANMAFETVRVLGWRTFGDFKKELLSM